MEAPGKGGPTLKAPRRQPVLLCEVSRVESLCVRSRRAILVLALAHQALACGAADERPAPSPSESDLDFSVLARYDASNADERDVFASGSCTDGATQTCRIYLPSHNGVQPCFVGEQFCTSASWGPCESAVLVDANADDAELDPDTLSP